MNKDKLQVRIYTQESRFLSKNLTIVIIVNYAIAKVDSFCTYCEQIDPTVIYRFDVEFTKFAVKQEGFLFNDKLVVMDPSRPCIPLDINPNDYI